jgi:hypothetical protein
LVPSEAAVQVGNANIGITLKFGRQALDDNRRDHRFPCSWNAWAEQSLLACVEPPLEFDRIQQPFSGSFLSSTNEVTLLSEVVHGRKPLFDSSTLLIIVTFVYSIHTFSRCLTK